MEHHIERPDASYEQAPASCETLADVLRFWASVQPNATAYVYASGGRERKLSFGQLYQRSQKIARELAKRYEPGSRAMLLFPLGLEFVEAFFACLYAGVVAVPMQPGTGKSAVARWRAVWRNCRATSLLTIKASERSVTALIDSEEAQVNLGVLFIDELAEDAPPEGSPGAEPTEPSLPRLDPQALAFLQYTSGSTSEPKGVMVTHANILANQRMVQQVAGTGRDTVFASWLPIFHDLGLIGNVLHAAYLGVPAVLLSTLNFIKNPLSWLQAIERYRATISGAPNFAYELCVKRTTPEQRASLDLSSWKVAFNGAEPVRSTTLESFTQAFSVAGFERGAFLPTYGLAEATLIVSGHQAASPSLLSLNSRLLKRDIAMDEVDGKPHVGVGRYDHGDQTLAIVDPDTAEPCPEDRVGEIWLRGAHVARGYFENERATEETFRARPRGDERLYLRTGDLGFVRGGELFVTGRLKDLIIVRGHNVYPQDLEATAEACCSGFRPGFTAAFRPGEDEEAGIAIVGELEPRATVTEAQLAQLARRIGEEHEVAVERIALLRRNMVPKTTSGKIQRRQCREGLLTGQYTPLVQWAAPKPEQPIRSGADVAARAAAWVASTKGLSEASIEHRASLSSYGIDSIQKVDLIVALEAEFGFSVPESRFFAIETISDLEAALDPVEEARPRRASVSPAPAIALPSFSALSFGVSHER